MTPPILIGTSGYSYDDWHGVFYPEHLARRARLDFYATSFRALEINATYYGTPAPDTARRAVREAAGRLAFAIKAPGDLTHRARADRATILPFLAYLEPFREAGVLHAVLLQFPAAVRHAPDGRARLRDACAPLGDLPLAVELRHASWDASAADEFLRDLAASRVAVDQPALRGLSRSRRHAATGPVAYVRFHGRNAAGWYAGGDDARHDRYRYRYEEQELRPWVPIVREAAAPATTALVFFNNHPDGNAIHDAFAFADLLGAPLEPPHSGDLFG